MSPLAEIENAITRLPVADAEALREWLEQWLEDQQEMTPEFLASIERGKDDLAEGRPSDHERGGHAKVFPGV